MTGFYNMLDTIKDKLLESPFCNTVTYGDISQVDLNKKTIFPLSHFIVNNISYTTNVITYDIGLIVMDVVDISKDDVADVFAGNNNEHDVFNTQQDVIISVLDALSNGDLYANLYQLNGTPTIEPFVDRFENRLAGWASSFSIDVLNDRNC